jgi:hypothetical protein
LGRFIVKIRLIEGGTKMMEPVLDIGQFIAEAFLHIWPYVVVTVPLAVAVQMSGASRYIKRAFEARPLMAILLATIVAPSAHFARAGSFR